jgi:hypothetical protein
MADIDQRIEALTQSVELLAHMHRDNERSTNAAIQTIAGALQTVARSLDRAYDLLTSHETRLSKMEGQ